MNIEEYLTLLYVREDIKKQLLSKHKALGYEAHKLIYLNILGKLCSLAYWRDGAYIVIRLYYSPELDMGICSKSTRYSILYRDIVQDLIP